MSNKKWSVYPVTSDTPNSELARKEGYTWVFEIWSKSFKFRKFAKTREEADAYAMVFKNGKA